MAKPRLIVEGPDDFNALVHLLKRHGFDFDHWRRHVELPEFVEAGGVDALLDRLPEDIRQRTGGTIGFVVDADFGPLARWQAVRDRLAGAGVNSPDELEATGFIGRSTEYNVRVGVWIMPNNRDTGGLEAFLRTLVAEGDPIIDHAEQSTSKARECGATFKDAHQPKAILHAWLAWQDEPGKPYGTAITAHYFKHNSPAADAFVDWFKELYSL